MAITMSEWTKVVTNPLGLTGFVLFLVFDCLAKVKRAKERRWLTPVAVFLSAGALAGGLAIAYQQVPKPVQPSAQTKKIDVAEQKNKDVEQSSTGEGSPNVQGVQGDVVITVDQSKDSTKLRKPAPSKPQ